MLMMGSFISQPLSSCLASIPKKARGSGREGAWSLRSSASWWRHPETVPAQKVPNHLERDYSRPEREKRPADRDDNDEIANATHSPADPGVQERRGLLEAEHRQVEQDDAKDAPDVHEAKEQAERQNRHGWPQSDRRGNSRAASLNFFQKRRAKTNCLVTKYSTF